MVEENKSKRVACWGRVVTCYVPTYLFVECGATWQDLSLPGHYGKGGAAASVGPADSRSALLASCLWQIAPATVK